jgi:hypothetical protein
MALVGARKNEQVFREPREAVDLLAGRGEGVAQLLG